MKTSRCLRIAALMLLTALLVGAVGLPAATVAAARAESVKATDNAGKKPTSVTLSKKSLDMKVGQKIQLTAKVRPRGAETKLTWKSSNTSVAKVSKKGLVKAVGEGKAKITVTTSNRKKASLWVTVTRFDIKELDTARYWYFRKYMSDDELRQAYDVAVKKVCTQLYGLKKKDQLRGIASALRSMSITYTMEQRHYNDPYGYFVLHIASCAGCTRATGLCLNILGIPYEHVNENQYSHQWARVKVGNEYWICDAFGLYCGPEPGPYQHPYF